VIGRDSDPYSLVQTGSREFVTEYSYGDSSPGRIPIAGRSTLNNTFQAAESAINECSSKDEALRQAILATEMYMKAVKLASSDQQRTRLRSKCKELLSRAEEIKKTKVWPPPKHALEAPASGRPVTRTEEIILLEGSKLHGFIFPPWRSDPEDSSFEGELYT